MRKLLLGLIVLLLLGLSVYMVIYGVELGDREIKGIPAIKEENVKLDKKIEKATKLKNNDYPQNIVSLESSYKKLVTEKESYEQLLALGVDENGEPLNKMQEYEIEKIWITMGNYAKKQGVDLKMDVTLNNSVNQTYDLKFSVSGGYIQIVDFLYDVERDSTLAFKLENFKLVPGENTDILLGTFVCKEVKLKIKNTSNNMTNTDTNTETNKDTNTDTNNNNTNTNTSTQSTDKNSENTNTTNTTNNSENKDKTNTTN